jgi:hypothetical protein
MSLHLGEGIILTMDAEPIEVSEVLQLGGVPLEARSAGQASVRLRISMVQRPVSATA